MAWSDSTDWGSVPDWIAGVGSLGAIAVALWVALTESRIRRRRDEDEDRRSARLLVLEEPVFWTSSGGSRTDRVGVSVTNYGDAPVHELELGVDCTWYASTEWQMRHALGPSETTEFVFDRRSTGNSTDNSSVDEVQLWFVDAMGRRWKRQLGKLEPERIVDYVPPTLPEDIRKEIHTNLRRSRRGLQKSQRDRSREAGRPT